MAVPAAVVRSGKYRPNAFAAMRTALYPPTFAWLESASIVCARESVRGIASRLIAVTPASASVAMSFGSSSGWSSPMTAWPLRSRFASSASASATRRTTSDCAYRSSAGDDLRPGVRERRVGDERRRCRRPSRRGPRGRPPSASPAHRARARRAPRRARSRGRLRPSWAHHVDWASSGGTADPADRPSSEPSTHGSQCGPKSSGDRLG